MLCITVPENEYYIEEINEFVCVKKTKLKLEHSLVSLAKWESKWCKPYLSIEKKTEEEVLDYIRCMTLNKDIDPMVYYGLTSENLREIDVYIEAPMTATTITDMSGKHNREIVTAEIIYYWMIALQIPFECQKWHLNRLITLVKVCDIRNSPDKKMSTQETINMYKSLNDERRRKLNTKG